MTSEQIDFIRAQMNAYRAAEEKFANSDINSNARFHAHCALASIVDDLPTYIEQLLQHIEQLDATEEL